MSDLRCRALVEKIRSREWVTLPGVYDLISARIADRMNFHGIYMTGYGVVASSLGLPDAGLATYTQMLDRVSTISAACKTPLIADGDAGYGGLLNLSHTVGGYERAGAAGIQIEDQETPKKCGHTPGRRVVPLPEAAARVRCAVESRTSPDFLIVARTDARGAAGIDEALRRAEAFVRAGADVIFVESPQDEAEMRRIGETFRGVPLLANMVEGGLTPILAAEDLAAIGYSLEIHPCTAFLAAAAAVRRVYEHLQATGSSKSVPVALTSFSDFSDLMGFPDVWSFEQRWVELSGEGSKGLAITANS